MVCQTSDRPQVTEFLLEDGIPLVVPLSKGLPVGSVVSLEGSIPLNAHEFSVDLLAPDNGRSSEEPPVALSFRARFDLEQVHHNSFLRQAWGQQEVPYWFPLRSGSEFNLTFIADEKGFKGRKKMLFWMFFHRVNPNQVSHLRVVGDILLHRLTYFIGVQKTCHPRADLHAQELEITGAAPYISHLQHPFSTGSVLSFTGTLHRNAEWLIINLQSDGDIEEVIVLQFNARFKESAVIHNTFFNGVWGWDFSNNTVPLQRGAEFTIDFHSDDRHIKVCVNGELYSRYEHRLNPERVNMVLVNGAVTLKTVLQYTNGTQTVSPYLPFKTCAPLGASPSFKSMLCELCSRLPDRHMTVMTTPIRSRRHP
ncbi:hypothetical protein L9F63_003252, partial [Diploptera punctata]